MTIVANTYKTEFNKEYDRPDTISAGDYKKVLTNWNRLLIESSVFIKYHRDRLQSDLSEREMTQLTSNMSTSSFNEIWEEEEDEYKEDGGRRRRQILRQIR